MKRLGMTLLGLGLAVALVTSAGCQKKVEVQTGTRTVCTYGEGISADVRTIKVPANKAGDYRVVTVTKTCDRHRKLEALYAAAQLDITHDDLAAAKAKLTQIVASDAAFGRAKQQLDQIIAKKKPSPDTSNPAGGSKPTAPGPGSAPAPAPAPGGTSSTGPAEALLTWTPDALTGYSAAKPVIDALAVSRQYTPRSATKIVSLVIAAEQFRDAAAANGALASQEKSHYARDAATIRINGHSAYFGTDGRRFAVLAFTDGAVLIVVEMAGDPGGQAGLKDGLVGVAKQLP